MSFLSYHRPRCRNIKHTHYFFFALSHRYLKATAISNSKTVLPVNVSVAAVLTFEDQRNTFALPRSFSTLAVTLNGNGFTSDTSKYEIEIKSGTQDDCDASYVTDSLTWNSETQIVFELERASSRTSLNCADTLHLLVTYNEENEFDVYAGTFVRLDSSEDTQSVAPVEEPGLITLSGTGFISENLDHYTLKVNCDGISETEINTFSRTDYTEMIINLTLNGVDLSTCKAGTNASPTFIAVTLSYDDGTTTWQYSTADDVKETSNVATIWGLEDTTTSTSVRKQKKKKMYHSCIQNGFEISKHTTHRYLVTLIPILL